MAHNITATRGSRIDAHTTQDPVYAVSFASERDRGGAQLGKDAAGLALVLGLVAQIGRGSEGAAPPL